MPALLTSTGVAGYYWNRNANDANTSTYTMVSSRVITAQADGLRYNGHPLRCLGST